MIGFRKPLAISFSALAPFVLASLLCAHPTPEMEGVRLALKSWIVAVLQQDMEEIANSLHEDFRFNDRIGKQAYLRGYEVNLASFPITRINDELAFFNHAGDDVQVAPVVTANALFKNAWKMIFRRTDAEWKVYRVYSGQEVPVQLLDVELPEQHTLHRVQVQLRDRATGRPVAARVHIRDGNGTYWPPDGHQKNVPEGWREDVGGDVLVEEKTFAYVEPDFAASLAQGSYSIEVGRGIQYEPEVLAFEVIPPRVPKLQIALTRWSDIRAQGWVSGDTHVHFLDPQTAFLEGKGEDLNVVNILATKWGELITDAQKFRGGPEPFSDEETIVYVNEETRHGFLGHTVLMNLKQLVYPLAWGPGRVGVYGGIDYPAMAMQADKAHAQGGFVGWAHFPYPKGEIAIDVALGKVDSVDLLSWGDSFAPRGNLPGPSEVYYRFLNCGFDLPATAGTDKMWNTMVVGMPRTYVKIEGDLTYRKWIEGIRAGRTFVTTGPVLFFQADGHQLGETIQVPAGEKVTLTAQVHSRVPVQKVEILQDGQVVELLENPDQRQRLEVRTEVSISSSSWVAARAYSSHKVPYRNNRGIPLMAHTSPIYFQVGDQPRRSAEDAAFFIQWVDETLEWLEKRANLPVPEQRQEMREIFQRARRVYEEQVK